MPTVDDLRIALNDLAADTPGLSSEVVLRQGRRLRTRRRLFATGGGVVVAGVAAVLLQFGGGGSQAVPPAGSRPSSAATTDVVAVDQLFEIAPEQEVEPGIMARSITYRGVAAEARRQATCTLTRVPPGGRTVPRELKNATLWDLGDGVAVKFSPGKTGRSFEWTSGGSGYFLACDPYDRKADGPHGPSDNELFALLGWLNQHG